MKKIFDVLRGFFKPSALQLSFLGLTIFVIVLILSINAGRLAIEEKVELNQVKNFNVIAQWNGTNGEVVEDFIIVNDFLYSAMGEKGIYVFKKETLEFVTNLEIESNGLRYNIKKIDLLKIDGSNYFVASFLNGVAENERGFIVFSIDNSNSVSNLISFPVNFTFPKSFCAVENKIYVPVLSKELLEICFDRNLNTEVNRFPLSFNYVGSIRYFKDFFYFLLYEDGLYITRLEKRKLKVFSNIKSEINYVTDCFFVNNRLVLSDRMLGILVYNVSDKSKPRLLFHYDTSGDASSVFMTGNYIYVADGINGILCLEFKNREYKLKKIYKPGFISDRLFYDERRRLLYASFGINGIYVLK